MAKILRFALLGGSEAVRSSRRALIELEQLGQVVFDSDGFGVTADMVLGHTFDLLVVDHKLPNASGFEFAKVLLAAAKVSNQSIGNILISSQFPDDQLRLKAIEAGAVDCIFVLEPRENSIKKLKLACEVDADFAIRELIALVPDNAISGDEYQRAQTALASLDEKEVAIMKGFTEMKTDAQIAQSVQVPKLKVRNTIAKAQNLLALNTRSQLLMRLRNMGQLAL